MKLNLSDYITQVAVNDALEKEQMTKAEALAYVTQVAAYDYFANHSSEDSEDTQIVEVHNHQADLYFKFKLYSGKIVVNPDLEMQYINCACFSLGFLYKQHFLHDEMTPEYFRSIGLPIETAEDLDNYYAFVSLSTSSDSVGFVGYLPNAQLETGQECPTDYIFAPNPGGGGFIVITKETALPWFTDAFGTEITDMTAEFINSGFDEAAYTEGYNCNKNGGQRSDNPYGDNNYYKYMSWDRGFEIYNVERDAYNQGYYNYEPNSDCNAYAQVTYDIDWDSDFYHAFIRGYENGWNDAEREHNAEPGEV